MGPGRSTSEGGSGSPRLVLGAARHPSFPVVTFLAPLAGALTGPRHALKGPPTSGIHADPSRIPVLRQGWRRGCPETPQGGWSQPRMASGQRLGGMAWVRWSLRFRRLPSSSLDRRWLVIGRVEVAGARIGGFGKQNQRTIQPISTRHGCNIAVQYGSLTNMGTSKK